MLCSPQSLLGVGAAVRALAVGEYARTAERKHEHALVGQDLLPKKCMSGLWTRSEQTRRVGCMMEEE